MLKTIYIINFPSESEDRFYDLSADRDELSRPSIYLREEIEKAGWRFQCTPGDRPFGEDMTAILSLCNLNQKILDNISRYPKEKCLICLTEPPTLCPWLYDARMTHYFGTIFTLFDDLVDNQTYFKFHHMQSREKQVDGIPDFAQKKCCVMVNKRGSSQHPDELYSERYRLASFFPDNGDFDLYGIGDWEAIPTYRGVLKQDKLQKLKNYKFCLCYENMRNQRGFVTERIFECMYGGCVPIYWGADNISDYVPAECFVDPRRFDSYQALYDFMQSMDRKTYESYLEAARSYLALPTTQERFSPRSFGRTIVNRLLKV